MNAAIHNFADWLPPMLVKELRQGLRTKLFTTFFIVVQALLIAFVGLRLLAMRQQDAVEFDNWLWFIIAAALLGVMPLRALNSLSDEALQQTLPLIQLTQLGTVRIVWGKWVAIVGQTALLVTAVFPYLVLRYFFGSVEVWLDFQRLCWLGLESLVLTTLCLAISTANLWTKIIILGACSMPSITLAVLLIADDLLTSTNPGVWILTLPMLAATPFLFIIACKRIANVAESFSPWLRLAVLLTVAAAALCIAFAQNYEILQVFLGIHPLIIWAAAESMTETAPTVPIVYAPWVRRGAVGRIAGRIFYEGWGSGMFFVLLTSMLMSIAIGLSRHTGSSQAEASGFAVAVMQLGFALITPRILIELLPSFTHRLWAYVLGIAVSGAWIIGTQTAWSSYHNGDRVATMQAVWPASSWFWLMDNMRNFASTRWMEHIAIAACIDVVVLIFLLRRARHEFRTCREMESAASSSASTLDS